MDRQIDWLIDWLIDDLFSSRGVGSGEVRQVLWYLVPRGHHVYSVSIFFIPLKQHSKHKINKRTYKQEDIVRCFIHFYAVSIYWIHFKQQPKLKINKISFNMISMTNIKDIYIKITWFASQLFQPFGRYNKHLFSHTARMIWRWFEISRILSL